MPRQKPCCARKAMGLPASQDIGVISAMTKNLQSKAEAFLNTELTSPPIVAATPSLIAMYEEDIVDAFEFAGLDLAGVLRLNRFVHETNVAYVGYGLGLCADYTDRVLVRAKF